MVKDRIIMQKPTEEIMTACEMLASEVRKEYPKSNDVVIIVRRDNHEITIYE